MAGFINVSISVLLRRAVTMVPALVVLAIGINPTDALVLSQVVLSFGIPFALIPLVMLTMRGDVMGVHVNRRLTTFVGVTLAAAHHDAEPFLDLQADRLTRSARAQAPEGMSAPRRKLTVRSQESWAAAAS